METQTQRNPVYRDRLFKAVFGTEEHKDWLLSLYNALNGTDYTDTSALELTTIDSIIYITMRNDLSFLIDSRMSLYEQQSSWNPNMPLRGLMYFAQLYQMHISKRRRDLYSSRLLKIPTPRFIVIYNGGRETADTEKLRLSDAFEVADGSGEFEWTATLVNINRGHSKELLERCRPLREYAAYVDRIRENLRKGMGRERAVDEAVEYAVSGNMLDGLFKRQRLEVMNMSLTEFDQEEYDMNRYNEGVEDGIEKGIEKGREEGIQKGKLVNYTQ